MKPDFADIDRTIDGDRAPSRTEADALQVSARAESRSRLHWFIGTSEATPADPGALTYEPHFGLREKPFSLSSDPRFFYSQSSHGVAFDTLVAGIRRREGILALMGEVGTGKTTLCRAVLKGLDRRTFAAFVPDPFLSREDLLKTLLVDFGVVSVDEVRTGRLRGASRTDLSYPLYDFLASLQPLKAFAVVMIDEAHNLRSDLLEEIRILSDLEKNQQKLLEVMLIGQPELQARLSSTEMRPLNQRVSLRCELVPLVPEEVGAYVAHRLTVAGNDGRVSFTEQAIECVATASNGIPRVINLVCDRALLKAVWTGTATVNAEHVVSAATDLQMPSSRVSQSMLPPPAAPAVMPPALPIEEPAPAPLDNLLGEESIAQPAVRDSEETIAIESPIVVAVPESTGRDADGARPRRRWLTVAAAACVVLASAAGIWSTRQSLGRWWDRPTTPTTSVVADTPPASPTSAPTPAAEPGAPAIPQVGIQMATFQSSARAQKALDELREAGYRVYSVELPPLNGDRMLTVLVGPYSDQAAAERDLDAARRLPGYDTARIVSLIPGLLPSDARP